MNSVWKSNLSDKLKREFFRATVENVLLYGATTWTLTNYLEYNLDGTYTRMLRAILNISCGEHPTKEQLYGPNTSYIKNPSRESNAFCWPLLEG